LGDSELFGMLSICEGAKKEKRQKTKLNDTKDEKKTNAGKRKSMDVRTEGNHSKKT